MTKPEIDYDRLARVTELDYGSHHPGDAMCAMEAVAYVAGEPWSEHPNCACPTITAFVIRWNDTLTKDERAELAIPLIPKIVGTRSTTQVELARAFMAADWFIRTYAPVWLHRVGLENDAYALAAFPRIGSLSRLNSIRHRMEEVISRAYDQARGGILKSHMLTALTYVTDIDFGKALNFSRTAAVSVARVAALGVNFGDPVANLTERRELKKSSAKLIERMCALTPETM